jgi:hypothetical protein
MSCNHVTLTLLEGPIHPGGHDYVCKECGQQFTAKEFVIGVSYGKPPEPPAKPEGGR